MDATKISVLAPCSRSTSLKCLDVQMRILDTTVTIGNGVLFQACLACFGQLLFFSIAIFWQICALLAYFLQA